MKTLSDLPLLTSYFFAEPEINLSMISDNKQLASLSDQEISSLLKVTSDMLSGSNFDSESLQNTLNTLLEKTGQKPGTLFSLIRVVVSWAPFSPALNDTLSVLGRDKVLARLRLSIEQFAN
jgi:glutamyl-tRNA synthetase